MRLNSVRFQNYRRFVDFSLQLQPGMNVLAGANGSGKTTLLNGISELLAALHLGAGLQIAFETPLASSEVARLQVANQAGRYRFESCYPVTLTADGLVGASNLTWNLVKKENGGSANFGGALPGQQLAQATTPKIYPLIAFYRADRHFKPIQQQAVAAAMKRQSKMEGYQKWRNAAADADDVQLWVVSKCLERLQAADERGQKFDDIADDDLAAVNQAIATALPTYGGMRYDLNQKSVLVTLDGKPKPFENLSDGQRNVVALIADIARRMCLLNPHLGVEAAQKTPGVVLLDELDMHLHPIWQRQVTRSLLEAFPLVQFVAASHSPQVLGELKPGQIILLHEDGTSHPQVSYGLDSSRVLEEVMSAKERSPAIETRLNEMFRVLATDQWRDARSLLANLAAEAPGLPEYERAKALLLRKETLGR